MILLKNGDDLLELRIEGYQSPQYPHSNWLMVDGRARKDGQEWLFRDPCLESDDLPRLASWLEKLAAASSEAEIDRIEFTEPNLYFETGPAVAGLTPVVAGLSAESKPRGFVGPTIFVQFDLTPDELRLTASSVLTMAAVFPER